MGSTNVLGSLPSLSRRASGLLRDVVSSTSSGIEIVSSGIATGGKGRGVRDTR